MNNKTITSILIAFIISFSIVMVDTIRENKQDIYAHLDIDRNPELVYRVYLEGKSIGLINSKEMLENYIDTEQQEIKEKYQVNKVYAPNDLDIVREYTYDEKILTEKDIYEKIKEIKGSEAFTINGYEIIIDGLEEDTEEGIVKHEDSIIYVIDKSIFENSAINVITAFIDKDTYDNYINEKQKEIVDTGSIIQDLYIENGVTITSKRIPTGEKIYTNVEELSQFLLFGKNNEKKSYTVKEGDTITDVSEVNQMSTEEFLIANTDFNSKDDLLFPGQIVTLGILQPQLKLIEERYVVEERDIDFETKYVDDPNQYVGYESIQQDGKKGLQIVTEIQQYINGEFKDRKSISSEELSPAINKIIIRGTKQKQVTTWNGDVPVEIGSWVWPTNSGYYITSNYGWRWGKMHNGIDIAGTGRGSPIKAANNGIIVYSGYSDYNGNYIIIAHSNGYYTTYGHMQVRYKQAGTIVYAGDVIGGMGDSGYATGVHLHFGVSRGYPYYPGSSFVNPLSVVKK